MMRRNKWAFVLMLLTVAVLVCTGCSMITEVPQATEVPVQTATEEPVAAPAETATEEPAEVSSSPIVAEWYFARADIDGVSKTAEQTGRFMHLALREDGTAENLAQDGRAMIGSWEEKEGRLIITFNGSPAEFTEEDGILVERFDEKNAMYFTHEVAGTYVPAKVKEAADVKEFDGTWNVKWVSAGGACQAAEYLKENFGIDKLDVTLKDGAIITDTADYGMSLNNGRLVFGTKDQLQKMICLLEDGMLGYLDYETSTIYYCEKAQ